MVNYALSPATAQALVSGLDAEYMSGLPRHIAGSAYLSPEFKGALLACYEQGPSPQCMRDAHAFGLIGTELTNDTSRELSAEAASLHGPERLHDELPTLDRPGTHIHDMREVARQLAEIIRHGDPSTIVLELVGMKRDPLKIRIDSILPRLLRGRYGPHTLQIGREAGGILRFPSLTLVESALQYLRGERAPHFCSASYLISQGLLNALHEVDYRMLALLPEAGSFDGRKDQSPLEALFHDIEHTLDYVQLSPFERRVAAQWLRIVEDYRSHVPQKELFRNTLMGRSSMQMMRKLVLDLQSDLAMFSRVVLEVLNPEYARVIGQHFLSAFETYPSDDTLSAHELREWRRVAAILVEGLAAIDQDLPTLSAAVA